jgi:hypothetical protein
MSKSTIRAHLDDVRDRRISASSGSPLAPPKASPAPKARASAKREILDLLGHARPQANAAMDFLI